MLLLLQGGDHFVPYARYIPQWLQTESYFYVNFSFINRLTSQTVAAPLSVVLKSIFSLRAKTNLDCFTDVFTDTIMENTFILFPLCFGFLDMFVIPALATHWAVAPNKPSLELI